MPVVSLDRFQTVRFGPKTAAAIIRKAVLETHLHRPRHGPHSPAALGPCR